MAKILKYWSEVKLTYNLGKRTIAEKKEKYKMIEASCLLLLINKTCFLFNLYIVQVKSSVRITQNQTYLDFIFSDTGII